MNFELMSKFKELEALKACDDEYIDLISQFPEHRYTVYQMPHENKYELFLEWLEVEPDQKVEPWINKTGYGFYSHYGTLSELRAAPPTVTVEDLGDKKISSDTIDSFVSWNDVLNATTTFSNIINKNSLTLDDLLCDDIYINH